jgi:triacylglycerol lipase
MQSALEFSYDSQPATDLPLWRECFSAFEAALLHIAPVYWGLGQPAGDGSGVIMIPGFLGTDHYLAAMFAWLHRMGYRPYFSGIGTNSDCPNLLIRRRLNDTIDKAVAETGGKVHLIGHSLGGLIGMAAAAQRPDDIASVITMGSPLRGSVCHPNILKIADHIRRGIVERHGDAVLPACYTGRCGCDFVHHVCRPCPATVRMTAIYTRTDAVVDWRYCVTGDKNVDLEVPGTHLGLVFNPSAYAAIAKRLAAAHQFDHAHNPLT